MLGILPDRLDQYPVILQALQGCQEADRIAHLRYLCRSDLYFLLRYMCGRSDMEHPWLLDRCREVQREPNGHLDLWSREHYKSTIISFGLTIQDILNDPEITVGLFSHTRPIAKAFLRQIKREFEGNEQLKRTFPDILYENPQKQSPKWSEDDGIIVKREGNPKEATVSASGLVDGQPTSKHFKLRVYDDIVVPASVSTPDMIAKTTEAWELSDNLGTEGGWWRIAGTRYHFSDTYGDLIRRKVVKLRFRTCTRDGTENFTPENCVLMAPETLAEKRRLQGPATFATQMLLDPRGDSSQGFQRGWLKHIKGEANRHGLNVYIFVDPANAKRKASDFTSMWVIGLGRDRNYIVLDFLRDRLNLRERTGALFGFVDQWKPLKVFYEEYGLQSDIQHIEHCQEQENYRFVIESVGGSTSKRDRIMRLMPVFEQGRIYLPAYKSRTLYDGSTVNLVEVFIEEEYVAFPVAIHDDMLDCLARIEDPALELRWPQSNIEERTFNRGLPQLSVNPNRDPRAVKRFQRAAQQSYSSGGGEQG